MTRKLFPLRACAVVVTIGTSTSVQYVSPWKGFGRDLGNVGLKI